MKFEPGSPKPENSGRKKGTPNKKSQLLQDILSSQGVSPVEEILKMLPALDPKQQVDVHLELMGYLYPKRKSVEMNIEEQRSPLFGVKITDELMLKLVAEARDAKNKADQSSDEEGL